MVISNDHFNGSNTHSVIETIRLKDIKKFIKAIIVFLYADLLVLKQK